MKIFKYLFIMHFMQINTPKKGKSYKENKGNTDLIENIDLEITSLENMHIGVVAYNNSYIFSNLHTIKLVS